MTLRHLRIFQEIAATGSFTKAAKNLYVTQSAVSHALKELEEQAKTPLFDRLGKSVRLTAAGAKLLEEAEPILSACEKLEGRMGRLEEESPIRLVSCITIAGFWLPGVLRRFRTVCPKTPVKVEVVSAARAVEILEQGKADLAFLEGAVPPDLFLGKVFAQYELQAAGAPGRVKGEWMTLEEFLREELLLREKGSAIRDTFESAVRLRGYELEPSWTSVNSQALIEAAKEGLGVTVLPRVLLEESLKKGELKEIRLQDMSLKNSLTAAVHRDKHMSLPLRRLWEMLG